PPWLAPEQVVVAPVSESQREYALEALSRLRDAGLRASLDDRAETLGKRAHAVHEAGVPFLVVAGRREVERRSVTLRGRAGVQRELPLEEAVAELQRASAP